MASIDLTVKVCFHGGMNIRYRHGQIGLMLLVVMGMAVAIVLSVASRAFTDTTLSRQERENSASFAIAESGIERALNELSRGTVSGTPTSIADSANFISGAYLVKSQQSFELFLKEGETLHLDFSGSPTSVSVSWTKQSEDPGGTCQDESGRSPASLEITRVNGSNVATRAYYNSNRCQGDLGPINHFAQASAGTTPFGSTQTIALAGANRYMRIKPLYNNATLAVTVTGGAARAQLYTIESQAAGGDARSDIEVKRTLAAPGSVFDFAIFSATTIIK